jgi:hypothetical protein
MAEAIVINGTEKLSIIDNFVEATIIEINSGTPGQAGKQGVPGPSGPRGPRGKTGPASVPKEIIKLSGTTTNNVSYTLSMVDSSTYLPLSTVQNFLAMISAYNISDDTSSSFNMQGAIKRNSSGTLSVVGTPSTVSFFDSGMSSTSISLSVDNTTGSFNIMVNGLNEKNIVWTGTLFINKA